MTGKQKEAVQKAVAELGVVAEAAGAHNTWDYDPEKYHAVADAILVNLLSVLAPDVHEAYNRVVKAADWWAYA